MVVVITQCIQKFNSYSMAYCPLCQQYSLQVYLHLVHLYTLCTKCIRFAHKNIKTLQFVFRTLLASPLSSDSIQANQRLRAYVLHSQQRISGENFEQKMREAFQREKTEKQDSESFTISTQDSENSKEFLSKEEKPKLEVIRQKYQQTVKTLSRELAPVSDTIAKTKERFITSKDSIKQRMAVAQRHYTNFSSQLPPLASFTMKSVKQGLGGLMNKFF